MLINFDGDCNAILLGSNFPFTNTDLSCDFEELVQVFKENMKPLITTNINTKHFIGLASILYIGCMAILDI